MLTTTRCTALPVSLLDNWQEEIARLFELGSLQVMTAYGDALASLRVPRASIDADLQQQGLVRFLRPDWRGSAQLVLTTYETLRDLEFSFAKEPWSILVCDEAQKIKNPNALVTRAVKKLNVRFRVACTGTPVENSLTDLWCLFDMVQPGLLGSLNEFGRDYGGIIENCSDRASMQLEKLRTLVDPQVIRRTKADVAKDLPRKIAVPDCRLEMSNEQRALLASASTNAARCEVARSWVAPSAVGWTWMHGSEGSKSLTVLHSPYRRPPNSSLSSALSDALTRLCRMPP